MEINLENSQKEFLQEASQPTVPAMDAAQQPFTPPPPGDAPPPPQQPQYQGTAGAPPIFDTNDIENDQKPDEEEEPTPVSADYKENVVKGILKMVDRLEAGICTLISKNESAGPFKATDDELNDIYEAMHPDMVDWVVTKCPNWLPFSVAYGFKLTNKIGVAIKIGKTKKANRAGANDKDTVQQVHNAATEPGERKNYLLYSDGLYARDKKGTYLKRSSPEDMKRAEKPNIKDLQAILAVPSNRKKDLLKAAFNWTDEDFKKWGITE